MQNPQENMISSSPILSVRGLTTKFLLGKNSFPVVDNISFDLHPGKTLALVGESGCGKTVCALSMLRILPQPPALPPTGEVIYREKNLLDLSEKEMRKIRGDKIAMIFQDPMSALNPVYTVGEQLMEVAELHLKLYGDEAYQKVIDALNDVGITEPEERINSYPHQLSGGMKQRMMIAMAMLCEPDILIADEPTTALDVTIQKQVLELMRDLQKRKGTAILLITHDMGVVAEMADEVVVMYATQAVEKGTVFQIFDQMSHPYTEGLFHSLPGRTKKGELLKAIEGRVPSISSMPSGCHFHPRCPYVMEKCLHGKVPMFKVDEEHTSLCWLREGL